MVSSGRYRRTCPRCRLHHHRFLVRPRRSSAGGEAWFKYLPGKTTVWWAILGLSVLTDFLFLPVALAVERSQQKRFPEEPDEEEGDEEDEGNLTDDEGDDDEEDDGGYSVQVCRLCQW